MSHRILVLTIAAGICSACGSGPGLVPLAPDSPAAAVTAVPAPVVTAPRTPSPAARSIVPPAFGDILTRLSHDTEATANGERLILDEFGAMLRDRLERLLNGVPRR